MKEKSAEIGRFLKEIRVNNGMSQEEEAHLLGVSRETICGWENGTIPQADNLLRLFELNGLSLNKLLEILKKRPEADEVNSSEDIKQNKQQVIGQTKQYQENKSRLKKKRVGIMDRVSQWICDSVNSMSFGMRIAIFMTLVDFLCALSIVNPKLNIVYKDPLSLLTVIVFTVVYSIFLKHMLKTVKKRENEE